MTPENPATHDEGPDLPPIPAELQRLLEADIRSRGVLVPVIVAQDGEVIDGRLRMEIARKHGLPCPKIVVGRLGRHDRFDLRVCINTYRRHLTQAQVRECISWMLRREPAASDRSVAKRVGVNHRTVAGVRRALEAGGEILHLPSRTGSDGKLYPVVITNCEVQAKVAARLLGELGDDAPGGRLSVRMLKYMAFKKRVEAEAAGEAARLPPEVIIKQGDFLTFDWRPWEGKASLVLADPPWLDEHAEQRRPLALLASRLLRPGGVVCCYTGTYGLPGWIEAFSGVEALRYVWTVATVNQKDGKVRVHGRGRVPIQSGWRPIVIYSKGDIEGDRVLYDVMQSAGQEKTHHHWQQPVQESLTLLRTFSKPGDLIVDPSCGSSSSGCACVEAGQGRKYLGLDRDAQAVRIARKRVAEAIQVSGRR